MKCVLRNTLESNAEHKQILNILQSHIHWAIKRKTRK